jgi:hypothetical protein
MGGNPLQMFDPIYPRFSNTLSNTYSPLSFYGVGRVKACNI